MLQEDEYIDLGGRVLKALLHFIIGCSGFRVSGTGARYALQQHRFFRLRMHAHTDILVDMQNCSGHQSVWIVSSLDHTHVRTAALYAGAKERGDAGRRK